MPEELLERMPADMPVRILWGENDPWEPIELGRALSVYPCVDQFVPMPGGGHCPMVSSNASNIYLNCYQIHPIS